MKNEKFWQIINNISENKEINFNNTDEVLKFDKAFKEKLIESHIFPLLAANFIISSYVSDEGFQEFKAWLILQGKDKFYNAIHNPDTIAKWTKEIDTEIISDYGEEMILYSLNLYLEVGGKEDDFYENQYMGIEPNIEFNWPRDKEDYKKQYPNLVEKYWNQKLINELH